MNFEAVGTSAASVAICRVTAVFVVFEKFGTLLLVLKLNFQAVIKSAASAASPKTKIQESRGANGRWKRLGSPGFRDFGLRGGCPSSRLDHSLKVELLNFVRGEIRHHSQILYGQMSQSKVH